MIKWLRDIITNKKESLVSLSGETNTMSESTKTEENLLDFEKIRQISKEMSKKVKQEKPLTKKEIENVEFYVNDMARHIKEYAQDGRTTFKYDCSRVSKTLFMELAQAFKTRNPKFYVQTNSGTQTLLVDWSGKNEA